MSKCIYAQNIEAAPEHQGDGIMRVQPLSFTPHAARGQGVIAASFADSPLVKALRKHLESYNGLVESRVDSLRPQVDDL